MNDKELEALKAAATEQLRKLGLGGQIEFYLRNLYGPGLGLMQAKELRQAMVAGMSIMYETMMGNSGLAEEEAMKAMVKLHGELEELEKGVLDRIMSPKTMKNTRQPPDLFEIVWLRLSCHHDVRGARYRERLYCPECKCEREVMETVSDKEHDQRKSH